MTQHRGHVRRPVELQGVQQVLDVQPGFGIAFEAEAAVEKQRVRILGAGGQPPEVGEAAVQGDIRRVGAGGPQLCTANLKDQPVATVGDVDGNPPALQVVETTGDGLSTQEMGTQACQDLRMQRIRNQAQGEQQGLDRGWHGRSWGCVFPGFPAC